MEHEAGREPYSLREIYRIVCDGVRTVPHTSKARRNGELDAAFMERLMLAVTEVNGCPLCSYAHAKMALAAGMRQEAIKSMLSGELADVPAKEIQAVMFAQHYAESRGYPAKETWDRIVEVYGVSASYGILGAIRAIMMGNAYGVPWGSFLNRFKGKPDGRSSLVYEVQVILLGSILIPFAMVHAIILSLLRVPLISFRS